MVNASVVMADTSRPCYVKGGKWLAVVSMMVMVVCSVLFDFCFQVLGGTLDYAQGVRRRRLERKGTKTSRGSGIGSGVNDGLASIKRVSLHPGNMIHPSSSV